MSDEENKDLSWGKLLAIQIMADMQPHYLRTEKPHMAATGFTNLLEKMKLADVVAKAKLNPEHALAGLKQFNHLEESRPAFYIETLSGLETVLHADFEKVQFAVTIREHPTEENLFQVDEADIVLHEKDNITGKIVYNEIKIDCSDTPGRPLVLDTFLKAFSKAATGIAQLSERSHGNVYAEYYALITAKSAIAHNRDLRLL